MTSVVIAGGGIAGLTTAVALQQAGVEAHVYEAAPELRAVGAGIWVPPNAMIVLARLGLAEAVSGAGMTLQRIEVSDSRAGTLSRLELGPIAARLGHATVAIRRSELQRILADALQPGTLHLGQALAGFREEGDVVTAEFRGGGSITSALLLGADGIHSAARDRLFPDARLRFSAQTCYRGLAAVTLDADMRHTGREIWGGRVRFGFSAVAPDQVYWFAPVTAAAGSAPPEPIVESLAAAYAAFPEPVAALIRATPAEAILQTDLCDLKPLRRWTRGRVALIGDAAHATTPNLGQGGAQAIEDALALALRVRAHGLTPAALQAFEGARRRRAARIVGMSRTFARISHWTNPVACALRNFILRSTPAAVEQRQALSLFTPVV